MNINTLGKTIFILFLFSFSAWSATLWPTIQTDDDSKPMIDGVIIEDEYDDKYTIEEIEVYIKNDEDFIYIGLSSPGIGWVAIGFSPVEIHLGADFFFGAVIDGDTQVSDQYGSEQYNHQPDTSLGGTNDIVEYAGYENSGTIIELKIKMNSGDAYDVFLESGKAYSIMIAYHKTDDDFQIRHTARFQLTISLK
jgi:hypothetical protein